MNQDSVVLLLTVFVGLVAISQLATAIALIMLQKRFRAMQDQVTAFVPKTEAVLESARVTLEQSRRQIQEVTSKANDVLDLTRTQLNTVDDLLRDVTGRARTQLDRVELVLDDTLGRVHQTVTTVHTGVMKPLKEISGISAGIRAAIGRLVKGGRPSVAQATQDEEMFI
jgi:ABC-type phosphate transport system auxiliary subunit